MDRPLLTCRICGKQYEACKSARRVDGVFRWQDVACCPEHGATYLDLIRKSRAKQEEERTHRELFAILDAEYEDPDFDDFDADEAEEEDNL